MGKSNEYCYPNNINNNNPKQYTRESSECI